METKEVTINVTANDITQGKERDCTRCPIARALKRHFPDAYMAHVLGTSALVKQTVRSRLMRAELPAEAAAFIAGFDLGLAPMAVKPIKFNLRFTPAR